MSRPERRVSKHPFRDSAILYAVLGAIIFAVSGFSGRGFAWGAGVGAAFFVVATGWSWWRFRQREEAGRP
jgi:hypothetical protein